MVTDQVTSGNLIVAVVAALSPIATSFVSFMMIGRKVRRENEADVDAKVDAKVSPVARSVADLVSKVEKHVPRSEIEEADRVVRAVADQAVREVGDLRDLYARLDERQKALGGELREIKELVKEQRRDTKAGFEKMQDCLLEISRKVG